MTIAATAVSLAVAGCGSGATATGGADGFPMTVSNCGTPTTIEQRPERVVALGPSEVETLYSAGAASRIVARNDAGAKSDPYTPEMKAAVASVPQLGGGGGQITREAIIAAQPGLVTGSVSGSVPADMPTNLAAVGIPMLPLRGNCGSNHAQGESDGTSDFEDVYFDVATFGTVLGTEPQATAAVADMKRRVAAARAPAALQGRTAAAGIVMDNVFEVYGRRSMAHTQFQALGLRDAFADVDKRVFDANIEEVIARNPDVMVLLSYGQSDEQAREQFLRIPGAANLAAVRNGALFVQPYEYSGQGSLAVTGLENMAAKLGGGR